jgi:hypothetical protein
VLDDTLRLLRIGHVAGQLRKVIPQVKGEARAAIEGLLSEIAAHFRGGRPTTPAVLIDFDRRIERLMAMMEHSSQIGRSRIFDLLIDLRFALGANGAARKGALADDR